MVQQTIQFETVSPSEIGSGTITAFLYSGDTLAATLANIQENSTLKGRHTGTVDDKAAEDYRLVVKFDGYTVSEPDETVTLQLAVGTYVSNRLAVLDPAVLSQLDDIEADSAAAVGYLTTLIGRVTSNVYAMWLDLIAMITGTGTADAKFDAAALSNAPGSTNTIVTLQSAAGISPGVIVGPSEPLVIGDDYLTTLGRSVRINLVDANGDPAEVEYGSYALDDSGISIQLLLAKSGKPSTTAQIVGTCTFFPAVSTIPPYLIVEFTRTETAKAIPGPYDMQAEAVWGDGKVVTFAPYGQIEFTRNIARA